MVVSNNKRKYDVFNDEEEIELKELYIEYGKNVVCQVNEMCKVDDLYRQAQYEIFMDKINQVEDEEVRNHLQQQNFTSESAKFCSKTKQMYFVWCFDFKFQTWKDGLYPHSKIGAKIQRKISKAHEISKNKKCNDNFDLNVLSILRLMKKQHWICPITNKKFHGSTNIQGYFVISRIDKSKNYTLDNIRIIRSEALVGYGFSLTFEEERMLYREQEECLEIPLHFDIEEICNELTTHKKPRKSVAVVDDGDFRTCTNCGIKKHRDSCFPKKTGRSFDRDSRCKTCRNYAKSKKKIVEIMIQRSIRDDVAKNRILDTSNSIKMLDVIAKFKEQRGRCAISGHPLYIVPSNDENAKFNMSIDRIDNAMPHNKNNFRLVLVIFNNKSSSSFL